MLKLCLAAGEWLSSSCETRVRAISLKFLRIVARWAVLCSVCQHFHGKHCTRKKICARQANPLMQPPFFLNGLPHMLWNDPCTTCHVTTRSSTLLLASETICHSFYYSLSYNDLIMLWSRSSETYRANLITLDFLLITLKRCYLMLDKNPVVFLLSLKAE